MNRKNPSRKNQRGHGDSWAGVFSSRKADDSDSVWHASEMRNWGLLVLVAVVAVVLGIASGWAISTQLICGNECVFNVALFDAIGTWAGGVVLVVLGAGYAFFRTRRHDREAMEDAENESHSLASDYPVRYRPLGSEQHGFDRVSIVLEKKQSRRLFGVELIRSDGMVVARTAQIIGGRGWGDKLALTDLGLKERYPTAKAASEAIRRDATQASFFAFTINGFRFKRAGAEVTLLKRPKRVRRRQSDI
ncbi:hypothetical protein [Frigoribacterium faeni]|uniref:hypothetical protein n=1 Tax=Frigoribacterium faeni TaxID=145483 RepID=UPI0024135F5C|nr:hypothetical protein [Frigoribacterium faeni]